MALVDLQGTYKENKGFIKVIIRKGKVGGGVFYEK